MRSLTTRVFFVTIFVVLSTTVYAQRDRDTWTSVQPIEVAGRVQVPEGEPARNVSVRLERFSGGIVDQMSTDNLGRFRFAGLQRGYYTVIVEEPGFEPARQNADLQLLFRAYLMFELIRIKPATPAKSSFVVDARVPVSAREAFAKGEAALQNKKARDAIPHLEKAIVIYPEFFEAYLALATSFMDLREWAKAEKTLLQALQIKPNNAAVLLLLGEVYWRQQRDVDAEQALREGLKLDDKNWHGHFTISRLYWDRGEVMKAAQAVGRTLQLKPDFAEAHLLAGNVLLKLNQPRRALIEYEEYVRLNPKGEFASEADRLIQKLKTATAR
jgi:tetratricopeptide (TPR) repeat protein